MEAEAKGVEFVSEPKHQFYGMEAVFKDRISTLPGGPRVFAQALERLDLCAQQRETHRLGVVQFLRQY